MSGISMYSLTKGEIENNMDKAKVVVLKALVNEGLMSKEEADEWCASHSVILIKKGIFRTITDRWFNSEGAEKDNYDNSFIRVVKIVGAENKEG